jgi:hypothetical protein
MKRVCYLLILFVFTGCGGGGGGSSTLSTNTAPVATLPTRPALSANSSDFSAGALDDDPASPTSARNFLSATSILPSINAVQRIAATSTVGTWGIDDILGKPAPVPSSKITIPVAAFKIEDARKDIVSGDGGFAHANCTEYAFERRNQLVSFLRSNGVGGVKDTLINTDIQKSNKDVRAKLGLAPSGAAMYWLDAYRAAGYKTGGVPAPGALAVYGPPPGVSASVGHVAVVEKVWYDTSTKKIIGWYLSERNIGPDGKPNGQLLQTCNGVCSPSRPNYAGFWNRSDQALNRDNLLGFVYLLPDDISSFSSDSVALTPQQLRADRTGTKRVNLTWQSSGNTQGIDTFVIYRDGIEVARRPSSPWVDEQAAPIGPVCYQVATKVNSGVSDQEGLSARSPLACAAGISALTAPALAGICQAGLASLTWASPWHADSISVLKNNETIKILPPSSNSYLTTASTNSRFTIQLRRGTELVESNLVSLSCSAPLPQAGTIATPTTPGAVDFGEQMVESNSRLSWVATYLQSGANLLVRGRNLEDNSVLWQQTLPFTGFSSALVDANGFVLLTYDPLGNVNLQTNSLNADATISKVTTQVTQIANSLGTAAINKSLLANQLAAPWKMTKSTDRPLVAVYSGTSVAADGTAPIWIFDIASGVPVLTKTIRLIGTFVMGLSIVNSDVFVLGGDGIARRYAIAGSGGLKSSIALQNPAFDLGSFTCFAEQCLAKANSTGILEVVDFSSNTTRSISLGAYFIGKFKVAGGLIAATLNDSVGCKFGLFRLSDAVQQGALQAVDCKNGSIQLPMLAMSIYDEWTSNAGVVAWTSSFTSGTGVQNGPKTYVYRLGGLQ